MSVLIKIDASPVVSGREDCRQAANGISARQPVPAVPGHRVLRAVFYRQGLPDTTEEVSNGHVGIIKKEASKKNS
jgi:hypothetical protein